MPRSVCEVLPANLVVYFSVICLLWQAFVLTPNVRDKRCRVYTSPVNGKIDKLCSAEKLRIERLPVWTVICGLECSIFYTFYLN
jgi:hypothetical protein